MTLRSRARSPGLVYSYFHSGWDRSLHSVGAQKTSKEMYYLSLTTAFSPSSSLAPWSSLALCCFISGRASYSLDQWQVRPSSSIMRRSSSLRFTVSTNETLSYLLMAISFIRLHRAISYVDALFLSLFIFYSIHCSAQLIALGNWFFECSAWNLFHRV